MESALQVCADDTGGDLPIRVDGVARQGHDVSLGTGQDGLEDVRG
jgi:hypothetical protein